MKKVVESMEGIIAILAFYVDIEATHILEKEM